MKDEAAWRRSQQVAAGRGGRGRGQAENADSLIPNRTLGTPRTPSEIRRADASFHTTSCSVKTDGASLIVTFPGLSMGIFSGDLQVHRLQRHQSGTDGCGGQDQRTVGGL